jgi:putative MATE family efflux protein
MNYTAVSTGEFVKTRLSLTEGSIPRALLAFSLPILFGNVLQSVNGSVNAVWVGKFLGESAFAAVGNSNVVMFLLFGVMFGFSIASTVMVGQCVGAKNIAEAKRVVGSSAAFFFGLTVALSLLGFAMSGPLLAWLRTPPDALAFAVAYIRIVFLAFPFMGGLFFLMAVLRGAGDSRTPFNYLCLSVVLDIVLNPLLIFGWGPFPRLGIAGSATATLIAQGSSFFALVVHLYRTRHFLCIHRDELELFKPDWKLVRLLVTKGIPMGLQMLVVSSSMIALTALVNRFGSQETAAFNAAMQLWNYVQMPSLAIAGAVSSMVAQNVGARQWDRVGSCRPHRRRVQFSARRDVGCHHLCLQSTGAGAVPSGQWRVHYHRGAFERHRALVLCLVRCVHGAVRRGACHRRRHAALVHFDYLAVVHTRAICLRYVGTVAG